MSESKSTRGPAPHRLVARVRGLFRREPPGPAPDELRDQLFHAYAAKDGARLALLCREHADTIAAHFAEWKERSREILHDERQLQRYVETLAAVAAFFQRVLDRPELEAVLFPPDQGDPTAPWRETLERARGLMEGLDYGQAVDVLGDFLIDIRDYHGAAVRSYRALAHSLLGQCDFHRGRAADAVAPLERAVALCEEANEPENVRVNLESLHEVLRYLGRGTDAAGTADRVVALLERIHQPERARRWQRQAILDREGEPLNRVLVRVDGTVYETSDAAVTPEHNVEFVFKRNRPTLRPAQVRTAAGEKLGTGGDLEGALAAFREAASLDPYDPHSRYESGVTLCYLERPGEALEAFRETERLAPGWFSVRSHLWLARRMLAGHVDPGHFRPIAMLSDGPLEAPQRLELSEKLLAAYPDLALAQLARGASLLQLERAAEARAALLAALDCARENDVRTQIYMRLGLVAATPQERRALLQQAVDLNGNLIASAMAAIALRLLAREDSAQPSPASGASASPA